MLVPNSLKRRAAQFLAVAIGSPILGGACADISTAGTNPTPQTSATTSALQLGEAFATVANTVRPAVVYIRVETITSIPYYPRHMPSELRSYMGGGPARLNVSSGTGFIIEPNGYIVTNHHVIEKARRVSVRLFDQREYEARIVGADPLTDIAVLKIDESDLPTAHLGNSDRVRVGEWVLAIGNPMGGTLTFSVTAGIVSATHRLIQQPEYPGHMIQEFIQTDAVANSGNSGGPLVDLRGEIVGMNAAIASFSGYYQGYTLAIPANLIAPVVSQLIERGSVTRGILGAATIDVTPDDAAAVGLDSLCGVVVQDIGNEDSPARRAGLQPGDVIVAIDGLRIKSTAELQRRVWFKSPGDTVLVSVYRDGGARVTLALALGMQVEQEVEYRWTEDDIISPCARNPLGVCLVEFADLVAFAGDIDPTHAGPLISGVNPAGPAYGKVFADTDIITHVDGTRVYSEQDFDDALMGLLAGDIVSLRIFRYQSHETGFARLRIR